MVKPQWQKHAFYTARGGKSVWPAAVTGSDAPSGGKKAEKETGFSQKFV